MTALLWDVVGERQYETGADHGVLYIPDAFGLYTKGVAWNGLTTVTESPSGAESTKQYADNIAYLNLISAEDFGATIEAFYSPAEFDQFDGTASPTPGVTVGQQNRRSFGFSYRTLIGNDTEGTDYGYKIHVIYGATAAPTEKAYATVNDSPEAIGLSWQLTTSPVAIPGTNPVTGKPFKPSATLVINSTNVDPADLLALENILYGTAGVDPRLPLPAEIIALFAGAVTPVTPTAPTFVTGTGVLTVPAVTGVVYKNDATGATYASGVQPAIASGASIIVKAYPTAGHVFPPNTDDDWGFTRS